MCCFLFYLLINILMHIDIDIILIMPFVYKINKCIANNEEHLNNFNCKYYTKKNCKL